MNCRIKRQHVLCVVNSLRSEAANVAGSLLNDVMPVLARSRWTQRSFKLGERSESLASKLRSGPCGNSTPLRKSTRDSRFQSKCR